MTGTRIQAAAKPLASIYLPISVGLLLSQVIGTVAVHVSNRRLLDTAQAIEAQGYLSIPTGPALQTLAHGATALAGGLFYTLSIGIGLTLAAWAAMYVRGLMHSRHRTLLTVYIMAWCLLLIWVNSAGPVWLPSLFCLLVPPATAWVTARMVGRNAPPANRLWLMPVFTLVMLTALWATQFNSNLFVAIRDHILLSNPIGHKVNDFYYRYTLYAAEVFKAFDQKTIRTYRWADTVEPALAKRMADRLLRHDVIPLIQPARPDVRLTHRQGNLLMTSARGRTLETPLKDFFADTSGWLKQYSRLSDRLGPMRRLTLSGLLIGFPVLMFITVYGGLRAAGGLFCKEKKAVVTASGICMGVGILLFLPMLEMRPTTVTRDNVASALAADEWSLRVAALRFIEGQKIVIDQYPQYRSLVKSPLVVERYWLARAMAASRSPSTHAYLTAMLEDPHPNVVCQAYFALGRRRLPSAIKPIERQLKLTDHWYTQWYGYRAMRRLGWHQKALK